MSTSLRPGLAHSTRNVTLWGGLFLESRPSISGPFPCPRAAAAARGATAPRRHRRASRIGSNTSLHGGCGHSAIPVLLRARAVALGPAQRRNVPAGPFRARAVGHGGAAEPVGGWGAAGASFSFEEWLQEDTQAGGHGGAAAPVGGWGAAGA